MNENQILKSFLEDVKMYSLLSEEEELRLGQVLLDGRAAEKKLEKHEKGTLILTDDQIEEYDYLVKVKNKAQEKLFNANLRLVIKIANEFRGRGIPILDLIQEGSEGLFAGIVRWDYRKGAKLSYYSSFWIKQKINKKLPDARTIRIPNHAYDRITKLYNSYGIDSVEEWNELSKERQKEILTESNYTETNVIEALTAKKQFVFSSDREITSDGEKTFLELVVDEDQETPERYAQNKRLLENLKEALREILTDEEYRFALLRHALDDNIKRYNLTEIADILEISKARASALDREVYNKLRRKRSKERLAPIYEGYRYSK